MLKMGKHAILTMAVLLTAFFLGSGFVSASEVDKGKIPDAHTDSSLKKLPWGVPIYDVAEAVAKLKSNEKVLWIDTRPASFFNKGTVRDALNIPYNKTGAGGNDLTPETLEAAITAAGLSKDTATVIYFCQGPKCHRSYNAAFKAITEWGYKPENQVWFREGYPYLLKEIKNNPKLKRKAKKYISDAGVKQL